MPATFTPLRYPGGKSSLYPILVNIIRENDLHPVTYVEPFAGGAGLAIKLLLCNDVKSIVLNDLDPAIASIWLTIKQQPDELIRFIKTVPLSLDEWDKRHSTYLDLRKKALACFNENYDSDHIAAPCDFLDESEILNLALASFYLNRTNRSGIMAGGPIGGRHQKGTYKLDARFTRKTLVSKIEAIAKRSEDISVYNLDASSFITSTIPALSEANGQDALVYFDPPYVAKGPGLYQNSFTEADHRALAKLIRSCPTKWLMTYDACPLTESLYNDLSLSEISVGYSAYEVKQGKEIMVLSDDLTLNGNLLSA